MFGIPAGAAADAGDGAARGLEELVRRSLRAMEDMVEALMRRPDLCTVCRRINTDLAALEAELAAAAAKRPSVAGGAGALGRRVEAVCWVVQIAADYLQVAAP